MKNALFSLLFMLSTSLVLNAQLTASFNEVELTPLYDRIASSYGVANGRVVGVEIYWNQEHTRCYHHYTLEVQQAIKGKLPETIVVVEDCTSAYTSSPEGNVCGLQIGTELIAFFDRIPKDWECGYTPRHAYASVFNYTLDAAEQTAVQ
ncbi:MAG: hypothetical protein ACK478_03835 [Flavobacteriales bacterium]|jgi:hypothetical protein